MYDFGSRLKAIRNQRGITQKRLAEDINKSVQAVSSYERNAQIPPIEVMISIADVLKVSLDYLVDREPSTIYSFTSLTSEQKAILDLIKEEFGSLSKGNALLSSRQALIIQKLVLLFSLNGHNDSTSVR